MKLLPQSAEARRDTIAEELVIERGIWLPLRNRVERAGGLDAQLNFEFKMSNNCMNDLLEQYFMANVVLETGHVA